MNHLKFDLFERLLEITVTRFRSSIFHHVASGHYVERSDIILDLLLVQSVTPLIWDRHVGCLSEVGELFRSVY